MRHKAVVRTHCPSRSAQAAVRVRDCPQVHIKPQKKRKAALAQSTVSDWLKLHLCRCLCDGYELLI